MSTTNGVETVDLVADYMDADDIVAAIVREVGKRCGVTMQRDDDDSVGYPAPVLPDDPTYTVDVSAAISIPMPTMRDEEDPARMPFDGLGMDLDWPATISIVSLVKTGTNITVTYEVELAE